MMGTRWSAERANINATASDAVVLDVDARAVAVAQIPAAILPEDTGVLRGNKPEGPPKYYGKPTKS
jgi:hypothetical protein